MRTDTANKLLKVIEEPPAKTLFILLADSTENILATILSRTQVVPIPPVSDEEAKRWLEGLGADPARIPDAVALGEGDLARCRRMASEDTAGEFAMFVDWMRTCFARDGRKATTLADAFHDLGREDQKQFLAYALHMVRQCIVGNYGAADAVRLRTSERGFAEKFAPYIHHGNVVDIQAELEKAARDVTGNVYGRTVFLDLSMRMMELLHRPR
jgi:DNA polymerase-3 subunit delta'